MLPRARLTAVTVTAVLALVVLVVPSATAAAKVPKVTGLAAAGSNAASAVLGVKWKKVKGVTYQVRFAQTTGKLGAAKIASTGKTATWSPVLSNICTTWYAQVRAKKGAKLGAWSTPKALKFTVPYAKPPAPQTTTQTSSGQAQVRWTRSAGAAGYRLDWSPAPFGNWPGLAHVFTPFTQPSATGTAVNLPKLGPGDHFVNAAYGNPIFAQIQVRRCNGTLGNSHPYVPVYAKPFPAGTGDALRFATYNIEQDPSAVPARLAALADNIADSGATVIALQEANASAANSIIGELSSAQNQNDWATCGFGQQQVMWRTQIWAQVECVDIGEPADGVKGTGSDAAKTPLPTPAVRLTPVVADPTRRDILVTSIHLEDRQKFYDGDPGGPLPTNAERKLDAHDAAVSLLSKIDEYNLGKDLPVLAAGDFKGNFGGSGQPSTTGYCDESSTPACVGEGQPTFIRAGFLDARAAVARVGAEYGTVNGHNGTQAKADSGVGGRADFIVVSGFSGISKYVNVFNKMYAGLPDLPGPPVRSAGGTPTDHNLIYADLFVPKV